MHYLHNTETEDTKTTMHIGTSRKPYLNLETDHDGNPLLPDREDWPKKSMEKKLLIQSYVAVAYHVFNFSCSISSN